jgi:hypothetical protein
MAVNEGIVFLFTPRDCKEPKSFGCRPFAAKAMKKG